jgi:regulator of sigma E protease
MSFFHIVLAALLLLGPLVAIHEFGHFWVARRFGVKVLTFSIGFGPALFKWRSKKSGTQYQFSVIPLGGFVKMVDEREGDVSPEDLPFAFTQQSPLVRLAIVAAGPLINLLFAIVLFWILLLPKSEHLNTRIWQVDPNTSAAAAGLQRGDLVTSVDGKATATLEQLNYALIDRMGDSGTVALGINRSGQLLTQPVTIKKFLSSGVDPLSALGFYPYQPTIDPVIGELGAETVGAKQGLLVGDRFISINGQAVGDWFTLTRIIHANPEQVLTVVVERAGVQKTLSVTPAAKKDDFGTKIGLLGMLPKVAATESYQTPAEYKQVIQHDPLTALGLATKQTIHMSMLTLTSFGKMITGKIGLQNISGPITIAKVADHSANMGWQTFLRFMAIMSVSLGVLNLMPIPVLDGGHIVYYAIEAITGRPVSDRTQQIGMRIGLAMLAMLMVVAIGNDISRLF